MGTVDGTQTAAVCVWAVHFGMRRDEWGAVTVVAGGQQTLVGSVRVRSGSLSIPREAVRTSPSANAFDHLTDLSKRTYRISGVTADER
jgi:hypothetical protein